MTTHNERVYGAKREWRKVGDALNLDQIANWYRTEYQRRTKAIEAGVARLDWLDPGTRVSLTEVRSYADSIGCRLTVLDVIDILRNTQNGRQTKCETSANNSVSIAA